MGRKKDLYSLTFFLDGLSFCNDLRPPECVLISLTTCSSLGLHSLILKAQQYNDFIGRKENNLTVYKTNIYIYIKYDIVLPNNHLSHIPVFHQISQKQKTS